MPLHLILGESKSGKSEYAEIRMAKLLGKSLYIGTLPNTVLYKETIEIHKKRRPKQWEFMEMVGSPKDDMSLIINILNHYDNVLLDGLAFYVLNLINSIEESFDLRKDVEKLVEIASKKQGEILIVDHITPKELPIKEKYIIRDIHRIISNRAKSIVFYSNKSPHQITRKDLLTFERLNSK